MGLIFSSLGMSLSQEDLGRWQEIVTVAPQELPRQAGCHWPKKEEFKMGEFPSN